MTITRAGDHWGMTIAASPPLAHANRPYSRQPVFPGGPRPDVSRMSGRAGHAAQAVIGLWRRAGTCLGHAGCMPLDGILVLLVLGSLALSILGSIRALR